MYDSSKLSKCGISGRVDRLGRDVFSGRRKESESSRCDASLRCDKAKAHDMPKRGLSCQLMHKGTKCKVNEGNEK